MTDSDRSSGFGTPPVLHRCNQPSCNLGLPARGMLQFMEVEPYAGSQGLGAVEATLSTRLNKDVDIDAIKIGK